MLKRKAKKVSLDPILQDCNITSASNIETEVSYPSDESFENRIGNRNISYYDLNKKPSCSRKRKINEYCDVESSEVRFQAPFSLKNNKKGRPSLLFDSIVNDSESNTTGSGAKSKPFKRKCLQKDISFSISSLNSSIDEANNSPQCRKSTLVNYNGKKGAAHISKIFESDLESLDTTHNNSNLNDQILYDESNRSRQDNITNRKRKVNTGGLSKFEAKTKVKERTKTKDDFENGSFDSDLSGSRNDTSSESNLGHQASFSKNDVLLKEQKSYHGDSANISKRKLPRLRFARMKKTQNHVSGDFDTDLDVSNLPTENTQARKSVFLNDSSDTKSRKNHEEVKVDIFESDIDSSEISLHCSRHNKDSITKNSISNEKLPSCPLFVKAKTNFPQLSGTFESDLEVSNISTQSTSRVIDELNSKDEKNKVVAQRNHEEETRNNNSSSQHLNTIESDVESLNNSVRRTTSDVDEQQFGSQKQASNILPSNTDNYEDFQVLGSNLHNSNESENFTTIGLESLSDQGPTLNANDKSSRHSFEFHRSEILAAESKGPVSMCEVNSKDENSLVEAQKIQEEFINNTVSNYGIPVGVRCRKSSIAVQRVSLGKRVSFKIDEQNSSPMISQWAKVSSLQQSKYNSSCSLESLVYEPSSKNFNSESVILDIYASSSSNTGSIENSDIENIHISKSRNIDENVSEKSSIIGECRVDCGGGGNINGSVKLQIDIEAQGSYENDIVEQEKTNRIEGARFNEVSTQIKYGGNDENDSEGHGNIDERVDEYEDGSRTVDSKNCGQAKEFNANNSGEHSEMDGSQIDSEYEENEDSRINEVSTQNEYVENNENDSEVSNKDERGDEYENESSTVDSKNCGQAKEFNANNSGEHSKMDGSQIDSEYEENEDSRINEVSTQNEYVENNENDSEVSNIDERGDEYENESSTVDSKNGGQPQEYNENNSAEQSEMDGSQIDNEYEENYQISEFDHRDKGNSTFSEYQRIKLRSSSQDCRKCPSPVNNVIEQYGSFLKTMNDKENRIPSTTQDHQPDAFTFKRPHPKKMSTKRTKNILKNVPFSELKSKRCATVANREQTLHNEIEESLSNRKYKKTISTKLNNGKLKKPKNWISSRMYEFIISKLKPKYGVNARVQAEKLVFYLAKQVDKVLKIKDVSFYSVVEEMKLRLAGLRVIETHFEFRDFVMKHFDGPLKYKLYPFSGNLSNPFEPKNIFEAIPVED